MPEKLVLNTNLVSVEWLKKHLYDDKLVVLDATIGKLINTESELSRSSKQIPTAQFFDIKKKFSHINAKFPNTFPSKTQFEKEVRTLGINNDSVIVVYDDKGIYSSARAWWLFKSFGHHKIAVLDGGLPNWTSKGYNVEARHSVITSKGNFIATLENERIVDFKKIQSIIKDKSRLIIDARNADRFNSLVPEPREGLRRGTIPQSVNIPFSDLLENGTFKSIAVLESIFNCKATKEQDLVFSCGSGITACILALGATLSGYKAISVYDGSWTEYGTLIEK